MVCMHIGEESLGGKMLLALGEPPGCVHGHYGGTTRNAHAFCRVKPSQFQRCGEITSTILTEMFTRQIPQNLKSVTVKITGIPKDPQ